MTAALAPLTSGQVAHIARDNAVRLADERLVWDAWDTAYIAGLRAVGVIQIQQGTREGILIITPLAAIREGFGGELLTADSIADTIGTMVADSIPGLPDTALVEWQGGSVVRLTW